MLSEVFITAASLVTPVGLNTAQTCASVRAGISRFEALEWRDKAYSPIVMAAVPDSCLPELPLEIEDHPSLTFREKRIIRLAEVAAPELHESGMAGKIPLVLGLPQANDEKPVEARMLLKLIADRMRLDVNPALSGTIVKGRAAGLLAVCDACRLIQTGKADYVLVGGCDTYKDIEVLGFLNVAERLKSETALDGFIPGEGAGFLLLTSASAVKRDRRNILGKISATAVGYEPGHLYSEEPYRGEGLFQTLQSLFGMGRNGDQRIQTVYSGMNGESHWVKEWGISQIRFAEKFAEEFQFEHPADCYGDPGAASGPIMIGLALTGMGKGYVHGPVLVYASSDQGDRAAVIPEVV